MCDKNMKFWSFDIQKYNTETIGIPSKMEKCDDYVKVRGCIDYYDGRKSLSIETKYFYNRFRQAIVMDIEVLKSVKYKNYYEKSYSVSFDIRALDLIKIIEDCIANETMYHIQIAEDAEKARRIADATAHQNTRDAEFFAKLADEKAREAEWAAELAARNACYVTNLRSWWTELVTVYGVQLFILE